MTAGARLPRHKGFSGAGPPDLSGAQWEVAINGLQRFVAGGWAEKAEAAGWTRDELYAAPPLWARVDLTGVALLVGDREVVGISATEIRVRTSSGSSLAFYRKREVDYGLVFRERLKLIIGNYASGSDEPRLRAIDHTVNVCRANTGADLELAKKIVLAAIAGPAR